MLGLLAWIPPELRRECYSLSIYTQNKGLFSVCFFFLQKNDLENQNLAPAVRAG